MPSALVRAPGIVDGVYPQRQPAEAAWLARVATRLTGRARRLLERRDCGMQTRVERVNGYAKEFRDAAARQLDARVADLRRELRRRGFEQDLVAQTFALVRELAERTLGLRPYDVQIAAAWLMLNGRVVELETGAGKTLTATLPACTAALAGVPVHIVTVNDYLVTRDAQGMLALYSALGIDVGAITEGMEPAARRAAYHCDITYTTNKQLVFDYLRDRLTFGRLESPLQLHLERLHGAESKVGQLLLRGLCFAIVDEADSILIDEARTPLIISRGGAGVDEELTFRQALALAARLERGKDFALVPRMRSVELSVRGEERVREIGVALGGVWRGQRRALYLAAQALTALHVYARDKHYLVKDGKIQIIDEFTGRTLADRAWERGLHQMIEAKEDCMMTSQKETLARISYQQFFRRYLHLAGMTGTAQEVAQELWSVYRLQVAVVPTPWANRRVQRPSRIYGTSGERWQAVVAQIERLHAAQRPVLVGTRSVAMSEHLSRLLHRRGLPHRVLNARQDESEAAIIKAAGQRGSIVVATNMAGRGTDIKLGPGVAELGGLHVIATEIHEARRIDRQLFGRCGRQGDPGSFEMILALEDELVSVYCPMPMKPLLAALKRVGSRGVGRLSWRAMRWAQKAAEREHARQRYGMLRLDDQLRTMLAFAGSGE